MAEKTPRALALAYLVALAACANADDTTSKRDAGALDGDRSHVAPGNPVANTDAAATTPNRTSDKDDSDDSCARAQVNVARLVPTVQIVVDASGSMAEPLGDCTTRWDCLRGALIGDAGLVTQLQTTVSFGLTLFGGQIAKIQDGQVVEVLNATCPRILDVTAALDNRDVIAMRYDTANPGGGTPTAEALQFVIDALPDPNDHPDSPVGAQIILLVTDGDPNACDDPVTTVYAPTEAQALRAQEKHIKLFELTVADDQNRAHLQRMANLGAGLAADATPGAPYFEPSGTEELSDTLRQIIGGAVMCDVQLQGTVTAKQPGDECNGTVTLDGTLLDCNGADGWRLDGTSTLVLQGAACDRFKFDPNVALSAEFPCDQLVLL